MSAIVRLGRCLSAIFFGSALWYLIWLALSLQNALGATTPAFVQEKDNQVTSGKTAKVAFSSPTAVGNLIVAYLIWDNTGTASVSDSLGNTYAAAIGPTRWSNSKYSVQTFYAVNLKGGSDTVTATFGTAVRSYGIVYAHEYSGVLQASPIDVTTAAAGTSGSLNSGSAITTNSIDLLFAGGVSATTVTKPGTGFTSRSTFQGNITEDEVVSASGSYSGTASNNSGAWAMQMVAFKGAASGTSDTTPPTIPGGLSVTGTMTSAISLSWTASTDNVGVAGYKIYRGGVQVGTSSATSYTDTGLAPSTTYSYTVSAYDAAGNNSAQSAAVNTTTSSDTTPPTIPTGLSVTGTTSSAVSLSWTASTDNVGVAGYKIYRAGVEVGTSSATSYTNTGLAPSTTYSYTVSAYDAAGNNSAQSAAVNATTSSDTTPPTIPTGLSVTGTTSSTVSLSWAASTDNVAVADYRIYRGGVQVGTSAATSFTDTGLSPSTMYSYTVSAYDAAGNNSAQSSTVSATTASGVSGRTYSTTFPLTENPISEGGNWVGGSTAGGSLWGNVQTTPGKAFGVSEPTTYGDPTALVTGTWGATQTVQGTVTSAGSITGTCCHEIELRLRMTISTNSITGYEAYCSVLSSNQYCHIARWNGANGSYCNIEASPPSTYAASGDVLKATVTGTSTTIITLFKNGSQIAQATDTGQNCSPGGSGGPFTSGAPGIGFFDDQSDGLWSNWGFTQFTASDGLTTDSIPPSTPSNLTAAAVSPSQVNLNWTASTDNVAVAGYRVYRNGNQIATTTSTNFSDTTVAAGTQYTYAVAAFDAAGNMSAQCTPAIATTPTIVDVTPPSVPTGLQSSNVTATAVTVSWSASSDNIAVAGYQIFRNGVGVATTMATTYSDTGLVPLTTYTYTIAAYDSADNVSAQSKPMIVTTTSPALTPPSLVQVNQNQISSGSTTSVAFNAPTTAGNAVVVYVIWNNAGSVAVTDSRGNTFVNVGSTVSWGNGSSAEIFYATNIAPGTDTITATFRNPVTSFGVVYVHEYTGISATDPVDVTVSASGSSGSLDSGSATTTSANDLLFGAGVSDKTMTAAGSGFTSRDLAYGNITEDRIAPSIGSYDATATHDGQMWGMQMVAFRAAK